MHFLTPAAFVFAATLPVVVVFYLLKRRRVVKLVSSTLLWQKFLAETQANAPFQKLRRNWLLLLQLLLLTLVVLALTRPYFTGNAEASRLRVLVLDGSASMQATDEKPTRFEKARAEALQWVDGLHSGEQMMVLLAGAGTEVKQSPTADKTALRRALESCRPSDATTRLADALKTAGAFTFAKQGESTVVTGEIHLFSDGAAPDLEQVGNKNLPLIYHRIGRSGANAGIVRADVRANPEDPSQRAVFANVMNFGSQPHHTDVELLFDGQRVDQRSLDLGPTNLEQVLFSVPQARDGVFTVRLTAEDDLPLDNQVSIVSRLPRPARVLLVTKGNRFLEKALRAAPNATVTTQSQLSDPAADFDVVVLDDVTPLTWPKANTLALHVIQTNWFPSWSTTKGPPIVDWRNTHPILRFVNFDNVQVAETLAVKSSSWGLSLVDSPSTPLIVAGEIQRQRLVWIGFDPLQSTWPLRISFPIFMANAVDWLHPAGARSAEFLIQPGSAFRLGLPQPVPAYDLTGPDGKTRTVPLEPGARELVVNDTARQGIYRVKAGTNEVVFCVNLMDSNESNILPREELSIGRFEKVSATTLKRANVEIWRWIALVGLGILMFEWWFYHKRTV